MADRTVYGRDFSENGWRMVDQGSCVWVKVPGTNVSLQIREGQPAKILGAWAADWNAYVEPLRDADSACWTATNDVASSNHLSGTAIDLNWQSHPFRVANAGMNAAQLATVAEMLDFYEKLVFWGNNWDSPKDAMHSQMNGGTYGSENVAKVQSFIDRKIRADGFSTFRRGGTVTPPVVVAPPVLSRADGYAVKIIAEGQRRGITPRGIQIALATGLVESNLTVYANAKVPASMNIPHDAVGSDGYSVGIFQQQVRDSGNGWWWGDAATCMDPTSSAGLFYDRLAKLNYNGPNSPGSYAQAVQSSAFPDRYDQRFGDAVAIYNRLSTQAPTTPGDDMAQVPQDQWDRVFRELTQKLPSRSPLRHLGEGLVDTMAGFVLNTDGSEHVEVCRLLAGYGHPPTLALLREVAGADPVQYPDRQDDRLIAQAILSDVTAKPAPQVVNVAAAPVAQAAPVDNTRELADAYAEIARLQAEVARLQVTSSPVSTAVTVQSGSTGEQIGKAYDALESLRLADALPIEGRAPLAALISVLQTKNGSQL
jgi:hypothetical protein